MNNSWDKNDLSMLNGTAYTCCELCRKPGEREEGDVQRGFVDRESNKVYRE
jgi:hypothetical protein